jgi:Ser-tRNA(Ala) deacylase AlaX
MRKVFWDDPYQHSLVTRVASVAGDQVVFEETIVFSFSGGQESDRGFINGLEILDSSREGNLIRYTLPAGHGLSVGQEVTMTIAWLRRYRLMRLHFAAELILELVTRAHGWEKVGAHIAEDKARIDFRSEVNANAILPSIQQAYDAIVADDRPIEKDWLDPEAQRRYWKIEGFAQVPCGGTHVRSTGEVGAVALKRDRPGKGIERIVIRLVDDQRLP